MDARVLILLFIVSNSCLYSSARNLDVLESFNKLPDGKYQLVKDVSSGSEKFCTFCEEYAGEALSYLSDNKTQTEIISVFHQSCSTMRSFKKECISLVDYYVPLFFSEISSVKTDDLCQKVDLCEKDVSISKQPAKDKCDLCHNAVSEALLKLKDPDTEIEIVELLLKACNSIEKTVKKCKRLIFEYAPIILVNAEQFLETKDVCTILHACSPTAGPELGSDTSMHASS